jgi:predicted ABC-type ATPase
VSADPVLHLLAGPNGAGKTTFVNRVLQPVTHLPFVNADDIAAREWPEASATHAYEASRLAAGERARLIAARSLLPSRYLFVRT